MRDISFRVWDRDRKAMIDLPYQGIVYSSEAAKMIFGDDFHDDFYTGYPDNVEIMQYVGLKDCNGKMIYEGDIIRIEDATAQDVRLCNLSQADYSNNSRYCATKLPDFVLISFTGNAVRLPHVLD